MPGSWDSCSPPSTGSHLKWVHGALNCLWARLAHLTWHLGSGFPKWKNRAYDSELWGRAAENIGYRCLAGAESLASGMKQWPWETKVQ